MAGRFLCGKMKKINFNIKEYIRKKRKNILMMIVAVIVMGMGVAVLNLTGLGPDPCSALHYAMSEVTGLTFGTYQLLINAVLFLILFFLDRSLFGPGTFGNMILVGYSADFTSWVIGKIFGEVSFDNNVVRFIVMLIALTVFVFAAATYMNSDTGTSPYDALSYYLHGRIEKLSGKTVKFKIVRILYDLVVTVAAIAVCLLAKIDMTVGIVTVIMVFALGPVIDLLAKVLNSGKK